MLKNRLLGLLTVMLLFLGAGCRYDMQDQPRYEPYEKSDFFNDGRASRDLPEGTVARGFLREDKAFYTGKKEGVTNVQVQTTTDASGNTVVTTFPDAVEEFPIPVTEELINRGQERYNIYCSVCHGPTGNGDGMIVRRGFTKPPTYHDDRLRNAPVGHFYDVITNGWGRMNGYAAQIPVADRWAIVAYIRALQIKQNPNGVKPLVAESSKKAAETLQDKPESSDKNTSQVKTELAKNQKGGVR
ncbi:MAG: cytochrome c [Acidobacteria bacterium]|jgi:mono/diheme cytochrome c family protein|nr:MAG: cytochrome c [Acidobacteriota bacterium]GIU81930.1 MAG: quinol:cytochrome C oxidoreductase [Pyrinomonadaceae bacterium]